MTSLDQSIFLAINGPADPSGLALALAILCAKYLFLLVPIHMVVVWLGGTAHLRFIALAGLMALVGALLVSGLIGAAIYTPRPQVLGLGHTLIEHRPSAAFPSNHAIVCVTWAATLAIYGRLGLTLAFGSIGLLVAWSRIYLGIHFPLDMVGALVLGIGFAGSAAWVMTRHGRAILELSDSAHARIFGGWARPGLGSVPQR